MDLTTGFKFGDYRNIVLIQGDNKQAGKLKRLDALILLSTYWDNKLDTKYNAYYNRSVIHGRLVNKIHNTALYELRGKAEINRISTR